MKEKASIIIALLFIGLLFTGCGRSAGELELQRIADSVSVADSMARKTEISNQLNLATRTPNDKSFIKTAEAKFLVRNVRVASERIEDLAVKHSGYLTYSNLRNQERGYILKKISSDSVLIAKEIIVENHIVLRIPNESLDSLVRELNNLVLFLDYRIMKMDEITFTLLANQKAAERLENFDLRQKKHIDTKGGKLKETTTAEESILNRQRQSDDLKVGNLELADKIKYCTLTIFIYQKPVIYKETQVILNTNSYRANLFSRILDALSEGWLVFEYIFVFLIRIWWLIIFAIGGILIYKIWIKKKRIN